MMLFEFIGFIVTGAAGIFIFIILPLWYIGKTNTEKKKETEDFNRRKFESELYREYKKLNEPI